MRKILSISACLLLCGSFGCAKMPAHSSTSIITYRVGGGLSGEYTSINVDVTNNPTVINPRDGDYSSNTQQTFRKANISPNIEFGAFLFDSYYLGFSLSKSYIQAKSSSKVPMTTTFNFKHTFRLNSYVDAFLKIGYKPSTNIMFFGLVGPSFANWSHKTRVFYYDRGVIDPNLTKDINTSYSHQKTIGLGLGAGMEYCTTKNTTLSFQYAMHLHRPKNINYDSGYAGYHRGKWRHYKAINVDNTVQKKVHLSYATIGIRFSYFFSF